MQSAGAPICLATLGRVVSSAGPLQGAASQNVARAVPVVAVSTANRNQSLRLSHFVFHRYLGNLCDF